MCPVSELRCEMQTSLQINEQCCRRQLMPSSR
ncbi:hypothetical protein E2C01_038480 [Portunus trituberculatus]|uniref:Uncharacterized protein n=1 Tax=Portunus trituberculatus TaxID=210409 RepID=A0A5B7FAX4_PORTR|nr:hypothetical protein [Portunus trituberculatus]